jgi:hypothetical protein
MRLALQSEPLFFTWPPQETALDLFDHSHITSEWVPRQNLFLISSHPDCIVHDVVCAEARRLDRDPARHEPLKQGAETQASGRQPRCVAMCKAQPLGSSVSICKHHATPDHGLRRLFSRPCRRDLAGAGRRIDAPQPEKEPVDDERFQNMPALRQDLAKPGFVPRRR